LSEAKISFKQSVIASVASVKPSVNAGLDAWR
jgi:hypothetical protein